MSEKKPRIEVSRDGPFVVRGLEKLTDAQGRPVEMAKGVIALCRCGKSESKPFCDGTHSRVGFSGKRERMEARPVREYAGRELTVVDNINICSHAGACVRGAPKVFFRWEGGERISEPDGEARDQVIETIRKCPSGSLAYKLEGELRDRFFSEAEIFVSKDGPLHVRGGVELSDPDGAVPATSDHYTLCRCGASRNKPFCDGRHKEVEFSG